MSRWWLTTCVLSETKKQEVSLSLSVLKIWPQRAKRTTLHIFVQPTNHSPWNNMWYLTFSKYVRTLSWYIILFSQIFSFHFVPIYAIVILHSLKNCNFFMILGYSKPVFGYHKFSKYIRTLSWYVILLSQTYPYILIPINIIVTLPSLRNSYFGQFWAIFSLFSGT